MWSLLINDSLGTNYPTYYAGQMHGSQIFSSTMPESCLMASRLGIAC